MPLNLWPLKVLLPKLTLLSQTVMDDEKSSHSVHTLPESMCQAHCPHLLCLLLFVWILTLFVSVGYGWPLTLHLQIPCLLFNPTSIAVWPYPCWSGCPSAFVAQLPRSLNVAINSMKRGMGVGLYSQKSEGLQGQCGPNFPRLFLKKITIAILQHSWNMSKILILVAGLSIVGHVPGQLNTLSRNWASV